MSSHCNRYPGCGCLPDVGTKCHLEEGNPKLNEKEVEVKIPKLIIVGAGNEVINVAVALAEISALEKQYNTDFILLETEAFGKTSISTSARVSKEISEDLQGYIEKNFGLPRNKIFKSNGRSELVLVDNPDYIGGDGNFRKHRRVITNISPKKMKRKKNKKTHR